MMEQQIYQLPISNSTTFNNFSKGFTFKQINYQSCEICFKPNNLIICSICRNNFHLKCLPSSDIHQLPKKYLCPDCIIITPSSPSQSSLTFQCTSIYDLKTKPKQDHSKAFTNPRKEKRKRCEEDPSEIKPKRHFISTTSSSSVISSLPIDLKKPQKKRGMHLSSSHLLKKERENKILISFEHSNPQYKRRKIKIGSNYNIDMYDYTNRYEKQINFDEEEYERDDLKQVWSNLLCTLSKEEINDYLKTARLFWTYRNMFLENELCSDFFEECERIMKEQKVKYGEKVKAKIVKLVNELKGLVRRGVDLNCHYDEMALKMLHICKYKPKVALLFLYKQLNPFVEEIEEGFKNDVLFFQSEIYSIINDGEIDIDE